MCRRWRSSYESKERSVLSMVVKVMASFQKNSGERGVLNDVKGKGKGKGKGNDQKTGTEESKKRNQRDEARMVRMALSTQSMCEREWMKCLMHVCAHSHRDAYKQQQQLVTWAR